MKSVKKVLLLAVLCSASASQSLPLVNSISKTIYAQQGSTPAAAGTNLQNLPRSYQKIVPGSFGSFDDGLRASHVIWLHSVDQNNTLGKPTLFDLSSPIASDNRRDPNAGSISSDLELRKIIVAKTKLASEPTPTTKLILIGKHKHQNKAAVYYLTKSTGLTKNAAGNTVPVPGIAYRDFGITDWEGIDLLLYNLGVK